MKPSTLEELQRECRERHKYDPRRTRTYTKRGTKPPKEPRPAPVAKEPPRFNLEGFKNYLDNRGMF